jgi:hypothetical protein
VAKGCKTKIRFFDLKSFQPKHKIESRHVKDALHSRQCYHNGIFSWYNSSIACSTEALMTLTQIIQGFMSKGHGKHTSSDMDEGIFI